VLDGDGEEKEESCEPLDDQVQGPEIGCFGALKPQCSLDRLKIFRLLPRQTQKFPPVPFISPCPSYPVPFTPLSRSLSAFLCWRRRLGGRAPSPFASSSLAPFAGDWRRALLGPFAPGTGAHQVRSPLQFLPAVRNPAHNLYLMYATSIRI
jgi:hypothetical protein